MSRSFFESNFFLALVCVFVACNSEPKPKSTYDFKPIPVAYPKTRFDLTVRDTYFGKIVEDPYRWLEDDQSEETKAWVKQQNAVTFDYLNRIPFRGKIKKRLEEIWNFEKYSTPFKKANHYYFFKNDGLQNQSVLYRQASLDGKPEVVLDPNTFSPDGTTSLQEIGFSRDGRYLAYAISEGGSDWRTILVKDLQTGQILPDRIKWAKFTRIGWAGNGFYYTRYPEPKEGDELKGTNQYSAIYYHTLGQPQSNDRLIHHDPKYPNRYFSAGTTEDERFLFIAGAESTSGNTLAFLDLSKPKAQLTPIYTRFDSDFNVIENLGDQLLILTNHAAPKQRLILVNTTRPQEAHWKTLIPEDSTDVLQDAIVCGNKLVCVYLHNAASALRVFDLQGRFLREISLPELGTIGSVEGKPSDTLAFFSFSSFLRPPTIYMLNTKTLETRVFKAPKMAFNPDAYMTEQVWYTSKDGTRVPMFITRKKNIAFDGQNPTLLFGYGGFNVSLTPSFSASRAVLLENNGIYVVANIRGGGEFGEKWHKAGTKCQKQNVFDDFIAAAEYLIEKQYTSPPRLAIEGGSNGGLLVGACMTQRPELFGVCFPRVGVLDMLRYHKFTIGYAWAVDYGRSDNPEEFPCLIKYSPLHNVRPTAYPATMITTADHDDRVVPAHSFKFAAALQANQQGDKPILIRIETSAGHGAGKPTSKLLEEAADLLAFMFYQMKTPVIY
ncbi:MAG: prolyl oligopeptidase family serine peptidase [Saprospiraceae bacterium]|nr:prolyl oligopeptidase family serine peptidase [Saprospiraceae bacterium]MDW8484947.1 prolyl oligopeptidase family serine peptidase [Saprospiraceae bacterium]